jgi:signal transduction histidine kinase
VSRLMVGLSQSPLWFVVAGLVVAAAGTLALAVYVWVNSDGDRTRQAFTLLLVSVFVWTAGQSGRLLTASLGGKLVWHGVLYVGIVTLPLTWVAFALLYTGRTRFLRRPVVALALVEPAGVLVALYTNPAHNLFYTDVSLVTLGGTPVLTTTAGPLWWVYFVASYLLIGAGVVVLLKFALSAPALYRTQAVTVVAATLLPVATNAVVLFGPLSDPMVDLTPLAFALSALLLFAAVFYGRFLDLTPVAHDAVVRTLEDGILVVDDEGQIVSTNPAGAAMVAGADTDESLVGRDLAAVEPALAVDTDAGSAADDAGVDRGFETAAVSGGESEWYWVRQVDLEPTTSSRGSVVMLTDITEKKRFERQLRGLQRTHQQLLVAQTQDRIVDIATTAAADVLDLPITGIWKHDQRADVLRPLGMSEAAHDVLDEQPALGPDDIAWTAFADGELKQYTDVRDHPEVYNTETPIRSEVHVPVGDWGVMSTGSTSRTEFQNVDFDLLRLLATAVERAVDRQARERRIRELHRETSALVRGESPEEISRVAVDAVDDVLGLSLSGIHLLADDEPVLEATAVTDAVGEAVRTGPAYRRDAERDVDEAIWTVFETGETLAVDDVERRESLTVGGPMRSVIVHALGDHGVFITSSPEPDAFDRTDRALAELFTTTVTAALDRVQRERELRGREREVRRQNERLEEFTGVVSHDLRSPLNQTALYLDTVAADYDDDRIDAAVAANERATGMVDDLLALARQGKTVENPESRDLAATVRDAWEAVPTGDGSLTVHGDLGVVAADHARLRQVFENLVGNAVEHGSTSPDSQTPADAVEHGSDAVSVSVGPLDDGSGIYVADDGPGLPADSRDEVFDHGFTTAEAGTGFGLAIVDRIVEAHGWSIHARESADGGARFEVVGMDTRGAD